MNVLFEDDGQLKAGAVLADQGTSLQVEVSSGRRLKVKASNVVAQAAAHAGALDPQFLWDVSGEAEFAFDELAREYYGANASAPEQVAVLQMLHAALDEVAAHSPAPVAIGRSWRRKDRA